MNESRSVESLKKQWNLFKNLNLLKDQVTNETDSAMCKPNNLSVSFSQIEASLDDKNIMDNVELNEDIEKG